MAGVWLTLPPGAPSNTSCVAFVLWFIYRPIKLPEHWEENPCLAGVEGNEGTAHGQSYKSAISVSDRTFMKDCAGSVAQ